MLRSLFRSSPPPSADESVSFLPEAALLVHAARQDGHFDVHEEAVIIEYLTRHCALSPEAARQLIGQAAREEETRADLFVWTRQINRARKAEEKLLLLETLWRVVLADGEKDMYESSLLRRLAGLLHIGDHDAAHARARAGHDAPEKG